RLLQCVPRVSSRSGGVRRGRDEIPGIGSASDVPLLVSLTGTDTIGPASEDEPGSEMADLVVSWTKGVTSAGWRVEEGARSRKIAIPWPVYLQAPSHLRKWRAVSRFRKIADSREFRDWWLQECGGSNRALKRFLLRFPSGVWSVPWELLV